MPVGAGDPLSHPVNNFHVPQFIEGKLRPRAGKGPEILDSQLPGAEGPQKGVGDQQHLDRGFSHQVVTSAKGAVASSVTGVVGLARQGRRWSVELKRSMSHAVDVVLGKSEELVDHFLPMTEEELGEAGALPSPSLSLNPPAQSPSLEVTDQRGLGLAQGHRADQQETWSWGPALTSHSASTAPQLASY